MVPKHTITSTVNKVLTALVAILLVSYVVSMGLGLVLFFALPRGLDAFAEQFVELPLSVLMIVNFRIPLGVSLGLVFLVIWILYVGSFALAWFDKPTFPYSLSNFTRPLDMIRSNYLMVLPQLASVVLVAVFLLQTLQESTGVQTGGISFEDPILGFLIVSYAPLVEEFSYRITTVGLLDGLHLIWKARRNPPNRLKISPARLLFLTMWKPESAKGLIGVNTINKNGVKLGISRFEWSILVLVSGFFGAIHYLAGGGWEIGKISTATLSGLAMGLVYLKYGAYAPILLHWFFNYYFGVFDLASQFRLSGAELTVIGVELLNFGVGILLIVILITSWISRTWFTKLRGPRFEMGHERISECFIRNRAHQLRSQVSGCVSPPSPRVPLGTAADKPTTTTRDLLGRIL